jgi:hypothetical protein
VALADRFESKVDRSGEHHLWIGSKKDDGTGKLKVAVEPSPRRVSRWPKAPCRQGRA